MDLTRALVEDRTTRIDRFHNNTRCPPVADAQFPTGCALQSRPAASGLPAPRPHAGRDLPVPGRPA